MSLYNTTSAPANGNWNPTASQFFCQLAKTESLCIDFAQFAAQPFHELCPSGNCWTDCQDRERLYSPFPSGITFTNPVEYGTPPNVTLWPLCAAIANITEALEDDDIPKADPGNFRSFFPKPTRQDQLRAAAAATQCWTDTCDHARNSEYCATKCAAVNLLESQYEPQFAGTRECIQSLCTGIEGLPFGNQDIVGIGVSISYIIQSGLIILSWMALAINAFLTKRARPQSRRDKLSESRKTLLDAVAGFQAAQCYFSIPLAVAAYFSNPFTLDPMNAFGLLPVSTNGFMPEIFTLMMLNYHTVRHWYPFILTYISYVANSVTFWAVINYLNDIEYQDVALGRPAYESLGGIDSCGGTTGLALCMQFSGQSPPAVLIHDHSGAALLGAKLAPAVWSWCTLCLLLLTYFQFQTSELGRKSSAPFHSRVNTSRLGVFRDWCHRALRSPVLYYIASFVFFLGLLYQATLFYGFLSLGLVDLNSWVFGQIVAITVWIPPVVDYLHGQVGPKVVQMYTPRIDDHSPNLSNLSPAVNTAYQATNRGYAQAADEDDEDVEHRMPNRNSDSHSEDTQVDMFGNSTRPNEFQLRTRGTRDFEDRRHGEL